MLVHNNYVIVHCLTVACFIVLPKITNSCLFSLSSCFISNAGVFFGAFLVPIFLVAIANACVFVCAGYVIIKHRLKQQEMKQAASMKKQRISSKEAWKLLISLVGFMILLGLSWVILLFTVVGADTNIYAAFAIQWLFVWLFNSPDLFSVQCFHLLLSVPRTLNSCSLVSSVFGVALEELVEVAETVSK